MEIGISKTSTLSFFVNSLFYKEEIKLIEIYF